MSEEKYSLNNNPFSIDPTENVKNLVLLNVKRLDDTINMLAERLTSKIEAEIRRIDETIALSREATKLINKAEAKRINAIRAVDVGAVATANDKATAQAVVLANQVSSSAETLRALVAQTATTVAQQLSQYTTQLSDRISSIEKAQYENIGKGRATDPQLESLLIEVARLRDSQSAHLGSGAGMNQFFGWAVAVVSLVIAGIMIFLK